MSGIGISWAICKSASRSRQITMPLPHHSSFLQAGCPSCRPTASKKISASNQFNYSAYDEHSLLPSVHWYCWLGIRKSIRPVKKWLMGCWCGYLSAARCRLFAYGPADASAFPIPCHLLPHLNPDWVLPFWYWLTQTVVEKRLWNGCSSLLHMIFAQIWLVSWLKFNHTFNTSCHIPWRV